MTKAERKKFLRNRLLGLKKRYRIIDSNGPLLDDPGYEECNALLLKMQEHMIRIIKELK